MATLIYLRNTQFSQYEDFIGRLEDQGASVDFHNPDYWRGGVERRADIVYTDHMPILKAYREADIPARRISTDQMPLEEIARIKGVDLKAKDGGWYYIDGDPVHGESAAREKLGTL